MKSSFRAVWLMIGVALAISRLTAQDVTVTDPAWLDPESPPADVLPTFKKRPKPEFPEKIAAGGTVAYALVLEGLDANGKHTSSNQACTNPHWDPLDSLNAINFEPAKRGGKTVASTFWFSIIFNPRSASATAKTATPRLLHAAPIYLEEKDRANPTSTPLITINLNEKGEVTGFVFENPMHELLRPRVTEALRRWRFAPARRDGQPVEGTLRLPLIIDRPHGPNPALTPAKVLHAENPVYPKAMLNSGLNGRVTLEFVVDENGAIQNPVVNESNNPGFNSAAIQALLKWKFQPATANGKTTSSVVQQPIYFSYESDDESGRDFTRIKPASRKAKAGMPEELRYDIPPKAKSVVLPIYPYALLRDKKDGRVKVMFVIDEEGDVVNVDVKEASSPEFVMAMLAALDASKFIPAMKDSKPSVAVLRQEKNFVAGGYGSTLSSKDEKLLELETKHPEKIITPKKLDAPLKPLSQRAPVFPSALVGKLDRGDAKIEVLIDEEGTVHLPRIATATDPTFGYAAMQAVVEWRFEPPKAGRKPAIVRVMVPFIFKLEKPKATPEIPVPELKAP